MGCWSCCELMGVVGGCWELLGVVGVVGGCWGLLGVVGGCWGLLKDKFEASFNRWKDFWLKSFFGW